MSRNGSLARFIAGAAAVVAGTCGLLVGTNAPAHADSAIGGQITRSEVLTRALDWYNRLPAYSYCADTESYCESIGRPYRADIGGQTRYRPDCSWFVSMAWHLSPPGQTTGTLPDVSHSIGFSDLRPGDLIDDIDFPSHHAILFEGWESDQTHFSYYSFGGGDSS